MKKHALSTLGAIAGGVAAALVIAMAAVPTAVLADSPSAAVATANPHSQAESQLLAALGQAQQGDYDNALSDLSDLISERPNFKLAQLVYGELMVARAGHGISPALSQQLQSQRNALLDEAKTRWAHRLSATTNGQVPASIIQLAPEFSHVVVADLASNRVYLFSNEAGVPHLVSDFYATIGRAGAGKQTEGDMRTPIGIYRVTRYMTDSQLPEMYGVGALPLNYPNALDTAQGRSGHGIWLHGVPRVTYARSPRASEGCVVLANDDFQTIRDNVTPGVTPVILTNGIHWVPLAQAEQRRQAILATLDNWRQSWEAINTSQFLAYYAPDFVSSDGMDRAAFAADKQRVNATKTRIDVSLDQLSILAYPGQPNLVRVSFDQHYKSNNYSGDSQKTQFWKRNAQGQWQIVLAVDN